MKTEKEKYILEKEKFLKETCCPILNLRALIIRWGALWNFDYAPYNDYEKLDKLRFNWEAMERLVKDTNIKTFSATRFTGYSVYIEEDREVVKRINEWLYKEMNMEELIKKYPLIFKESGTKILKKEEFIDKLLNKKLTEEFVIERRKKEEEEEMFSKT